MKSLYASTAIALLFGLGVTVTSAPAQAAGSADNIVVAQAGGGAGGGGAGGGGAAGGGAGGAGGGQAGGVAGGGGGAGPTAGPGGSQPTGVGESAGGAASGSDSGAAHPLDEDAARPELAMQCDDVSGDGFIDADEARACYRENFGAISGGTEPLTLERFTETGMAGDDEADTVFAEIDADGDGQISEEEWLAWRERGFADATRGTEGRMSVDDFGNWDHGREARTGQ